MLRRTVRPIRVVLNRSFHVAPLLRQNSVKPFKQDVYVTDNQGYKHFKNAGGAPSYQKYYIYFYAALGAVVIYVLVHVEKEPVFGRYRIIFASHKTEKQEGANAFAQMRSRYRELPPNHPVR
jgi:hypothetical protein